MVWPPCSPRGLSRVFPSITIWKDHSFVLNLFLWSNSHIYMRVLIASVGRSVVPKHQEEMTPHLVVFFSSSNPVLSWWHLVLPELNFISNLELTNAVFLTERSCLNYANELYVFLGICLSSRFRSIVFWPRMAQFVPMLSQNACCAGPGATLPVLKLFFFFFLSLSN